MTMEPCSLLLSPVLPHPSLPDAPGTAFTVAARTFPDCHSPAAPRAGLEPATTRLTAECSTIELSRIILKACTFRTAHWHTFHDTLLRYSLPLLFRSLPLPPWISPRPISSSQLRALLHFHPCPINLVVSEGSYSLRMGDLFLRGASRLDAFSVYPFPTWLLCRALGRTTNPPEVSPSRSSRTEDSSSQISCARAG